MNKLKDLTNDEYFSTYDLAKAKWFPIESHTTILLLIKYGKLKVINQSKIGIKMKIPKESVIKYLVECDEMKKEYFDRQKKIKEMRKKGITFAGIGKIFNLSRQRIFQLFNK